MDMIAISVISYCLGKVLNKNDDWAFEVYLSFKNIHHNT